jgi:hyaluronoglucosaminidase
MSRPAAAPAAARSGAGFAQRGVVEGFYGTPWSHAERLRAVERLGRQGMNRYVHAPKDDPLHRTRWREPYPPEAMAEFAELIERGGRAGVLVGFAVSPGLSMRYASREDGGALAAKLRGFLALGARFFGLALDDVPSRLVHAEDRAAFPSLAAAHVAVAHALREALGEEATLWLVPTDYVGVESTDYLEELGERLDAAIEVGWTGRTVVSPTVRTDEAARRARALRRPLLLWDNFPVADGPMRSLLHLGPYAGREAALAEHLSGVLLNPMAWPRASGLALATAAAFLGDPARYDPERAWQAAAAELGAGAPQAFELFARAHRFSALTPDDRDGELEEAWSALRAELAAQDPGAPPTPGARDLLTRTRERLIRRRTAAPALREGLADRTLLAEIEPWIAGWEEETERMDAAAELLDSLVGERPRMEKVLAFLRFESRLRRPPPGTVSYGPRRVLYPQLASLRDDEAGFGADAALYRDRSLAEEVVRFAEERALSLLAAPAA